MKKLLMIVAVMAFVSTASFAQTEKGKMIVSGASDLSYSSVKETPEQNGREGESTKYKNFNISPTLGYFVMDNLAVGLMFDYTSQKEKEEGSEEGKYNTFMFGPMVRYYFGTTNIKPYVHADVMFGSSKSEQGNTETKYKSTGWDLGGGVAFFLNEYVSIDMGLKYGSLTEKNKDNSEYKYKTKGLAFTGGFSIFF